MPPALFPRWKFVLANSKDLSNVTELHQARQRQLSVVLNQPGAASFTYPMRHAHAALIDTYKTALKCYRWSPILQAWKLIWSGYVLTIDEDLTNEMMTVSCVGWLERLNRRFLRRERVNTYVAGSSVDDGSIIFDLLSEANGVMTTEYAAGTSQVVMPDGVTIRWPSGSSPNVPTWIKQGSKLPNEGTGGATAYTNAYRGKRYEKYQNILPAMAELTQIESGADIEVTPDTRLLNVYRKKMRDLPNVLFGFGWGPNNIAQMGRQIDGSVQVNHELVLGRTGAAPQFADDPTSQDSVGPLEEQMALTDVGDRIVLSTYAAGEVLIRKDSRQIFAVTPFPFTKGSSVPEPFVDYDLGDRVYMRAILPPRVNVQNAAGTGPLGVRVFGMGVSIDDNGMERLGQLQLSP